MEITNNYGFNFKYSEFQNEASKHLKNDDSVFNCGVSNAETEEEFEYEEVEEEVFDDKADSLNAGSSKENVNSSNSNSKSGFSINKNIEDFKQGYTNDCWLLSGLESFSNSPKARQILKDAVTVNDDGTYTLSFKGINIDVTVTDAELQKARNEKDLSSGDDDVLLFEVGIKKAYEQIRDNNLEVLDSLDAHIRDNSEDVLDIGSFRDFVYTFTGEIADVFWYDTDNISSIMNNIANDVNNGKTLVTGCFIGPDKGEKPLIVKDIYGNKVTLTPGGEHLLSIKEITNDKVVVINPLDSNKEIELSRKVFNNNVECISTYTLPED